MYLFVVFGKGKFIFCAVFFLKSQFATTSGSFDENGRFAHSNACGKVDETLDYLKKNL